MSDLNTFKQPKSFYLIFSIEFWERFGFYGMQAILTVYLVKILGMDESTSFVLFGAFSALIYGFVAAGGWLGDKVIGTKRAITLGAIILMVGYALLGVSTTSQHIGGSTLIFIAMGFITVGNGLFKANPSSLLAKVYDENDPRLDGAFTMYYMAINIGSLISMILTPIIAEKAGYGMAFGVSAIGLAITVVIFLAYLKMLKSVGSPADLAPVNKSKMLMVIVGSVIASFICSYLLQNLFLAHGILVIAGLAILFFYFKEALSMTGIERQKMFVAFILMLQGIVFFVLYFQMPTSLNFFAIHNVSHDLFGFSAEPEQFQALNPFWIMIASPILAIIYGKLGDSLSMPFKFAIGMALCALSFLVLSWGAGFANSQGIISSNWLVLSYLFQSIGELLVSGLGLAMVAQLVPQRMMGFAMGMWFLTSATAAVIAGWVASLTSVPSNITDANQSLVIYGDVFGKIGYTTAAIAVITFIIAPKLTKVSRGESASVAQPAEA
ncbi:MULTISPECIES: dipeptide/tripeptide permease DtpA [Vibrio]|uniref:Dipeptide/tripeptide permease DtpA n=2 Tax=Vibrio TaxID=662 RepID=A0A7X4RUJ5_9VIBR|nr:MULTISPECIES: dipeptide/tripeptide permease DtpA [Vibrio]MBF8999817.1 dipeptide/tripeptide permease DtpA [Vibrio nitrifigilis]MZI93578.1 dipeptide/tripeptide permease DtpA [Vibrio eleionomae]